MMTKSKMILVNPNIPATIIKIHYSLQEGNELQLQEESLPHFQSAVIIYFFVAKSITYKYTILFPPLRLPKLTAIQVAVAIM